MPIPNLSLLVLWFSFLWLSLPCPSSLSQAQVPPITPSGLNTQVSEPIVVGGQTRYDITGGTRPNGGLNLFHSFGDFGVPTNSIASFQNTLVNGVLPATSNILGRVTGGNISNIFGTIQTADFGNANLFLMNPAGFLFGPNATVNVGGMVAFTSADYLRLGELGSSNAGIFRADSAQASILTNAPVAAFGFLGSNPGAITVKGSRFIAESISLVGGNISIESGTPEGGTVQPARLSAPNGNILLASARSPGAFDVNTLQPLPNVDDATFASFGSVSLGENSIVDVSGTGKVSILGGQFVLEVAKAVLSTSGNSSSGADNIIFNNKSTITAATTGAENAGSVTVNAESIVLLGNSSITSTTEGKGNGGLVSLTAPSIEFHENSNIRTVTSGLGDAGDVELQGNQVSLTESSISARTENEGRGGNIRIQGLTGEGSRATDVMISTGSRVVTETIGDGDTQQGSAGNILVETARLNLSDGSLFNATSRGSTGDAGNITIHATDSLTISGRSTLFSGSIKDSLGNAGHISINAPSVLIDGSNLLTETQGTGAGGNIFVNANSVTLQNGGKLSVESFGTVPEAIGGTITIDGNIISSSGGAIINASTNGPAPGGIISLRGNQKISLIDSSVGTNTQSFELDGGNAGRIQFVSPVIDLQGSVLTSSTLGGGRAGAIILEGASINLGASPFSMPFDVGTDVDARTEGIGSGGNIIIRGFQGEGSRADSVALSGFTRVLTETIGTFGNEGDAGKITIDAARLSISDSTRVGSESQSSAGDAGSIHVTANKATISSQSLLTTSTDGVGNAGMIEIKAGALTLNSNGQIVSSSVQTGKAGTVTIQGLASPAQSVLIDGPGSGIFTETQGTGQGGNIFVNANTVTLQNGGTLSAATSGTKVTATGGNITVHADQIALQSGAVITSNTSGPGDGGTVSLYANESISLVHSSIASNSETPPGTPIVGNSGQLNLSAPIMTLEQGSALLARTTGAGRAGTIELNANTLSLADESVVQTSTSSAGLAGSISVQGLGGSGTKAHTVLLAGGSSLSSDSQGNDEGEGGAAGNILVETQTLSLFGGSQITTSSISSPGDAGTITINAGEEVQLSQGILTSRSESNISDEFVNDYVIGNAGSIIVSGPTVTLKNNSRIASTTDSRYTGDPSKGNAGSVIVNATNLSLTEGSQLTSSSIIGDSGQSPVGNAGNVTVQVLASPASSVLINGAGSGFFTDTRGTGAGGNITLNANTVTLQNGGTLSAKTSGSATTAAGGSITVNATNQVIMTDGALITARSTGPGNAGNILINAGQQFEMHDSSITTTATKASGGKIDIQAVDRVLLVNSPISTTVRSGAGSGGNITIDPNVVVLLNSPITAQADRGAGGNITITTPLFLADSSSPVSASSRFGVNGTVTIQSPNAPASGHIQPLDKSPLQATSLLNQRCASLAGGEFSSFTMAGRDSLPTEPGSWLASPLAFATLSEGSGLGTKAEGGKAEGMSASPGQVASGQWRVGDIQILSLRQIAPAGFLTQAFAVDWSAGCAS